MHRKDVRKKVKKKIKLGDYILTYKRLLLILCSAEKKKIPLGGPRQGS